MSMAGPSCHSTQSLAPSPPGTPVIALVGAPNAGKSTLFNALTRSKATMGNWPGTTVEISRGRWKTSEQLYDVIDYPGAYSLDPQSPDEEFTREHLVDRPQSERPDLVIVAVDASNLARGLYMVAQLAELPYRLVVVLTKVDVAASHGVTVDAQALEHAMGLPVVALDPRRRTLGAIEDVVEQQLNRRLESVVPVRDAGTTDGDATSDDLDFLAADARFEWVDRMVQASTTEDTPRRSFSDAIDRVVLHPFAGSIVFLAAMWLVFQITTTVAAPLQDGLDSFFNGTVATFVENAFDAAHITNGIVRGFVINGLIGGVGMVLTFAPLMAIMFLCLAILEDSGYMARAAVVADRVMRSIGLPGKAFLPLIVGFGCNVPAISATRVLSDAQHRIMTCLLVPFTSCSARLTVYVMIATIFFPSNSGTVVFAMYVISILLVVVAGLLLRNTLWKTMGSEPLVMDLPVYQLPTPRLALSVTWMRLKGFLKTAGGIIVATVAIIWALQSAPVVSGYSFADPDLEPRDSAYGAISQTIAPVFEPAGFGSWSLTGPLITGFVAKEAVISTWAQTYSVADPTADDAADGAAGGPGAQAAGTLSEKVRQDFDAASHGRTIPAVWAFMVFLLAYTPCVATLAAQRREIGLKWTAFGLVMQLTVAWLLAVAVFQGLSAIMA